jgi:hypothetical protein
MKARDQRVFRYVTRASRRNNIKRRQVGMKENVQASQQQATTVDSKALTSSECTHESAGPTSIRVRHKSEQAKQQQVKTGRYEGERTSEPATSNDRGLKGTDIVRMRS